jgi:uncharacterized protein
VVKVRVTEVDIPRKRIGLSMRKDGDAAQAGAERSERGPRATTADRPHKHSHRPAPQQNSAPPAGGALGAALLDAMRRKP